METKDLIILFEKALKRDREILNRYPNSLFLKALVKNTEQCLNELKEVKKFEDLEIKKQILYN